MFLAESKFKKFMSLLKLSSSVVHTVGAVSAHRECVEFTDGQEEGVKAHTCSALTHLSED